MDELVKELRGELRTATGRRVRAVQPGGGETFRQSVTTVMDDPGVIPVIPPDLRPMVQLDVTALPLPI